MELDSLRERMQRIHVETEGREEMRLLQQDREEGEGQGWRWVSRMRVPECCFPCVCAYTFCDVVWRRAPGMLAGREKGSSASQGRTARS